MFFLIQKKLIHLIVNFLKITFTYFKTYYLINTLLIKIVVLDMILENNRKLLIFVKYHIF